MKRLGLFEDLSMLIYKTLEATEGEKLSIPAFANQILLHTNFPDQSLDGESISDDESQMLTEFTAGLWKEIIRANYRFQIRIVDQIETEVKGTCAAKNWDWQAIQFDFSKLREYEESLRRSDLGELASIPDVQDNGIDKKEPYLEWTREISKLQRLANILESEEKWILNRKNFIDLLAPEVTIPIQVQCNAGFEYHFAVLIQLLRQDGWLQPRESNGYFNVLQNCLRTVDGKVFEKKLRQLPTAVRKSPRKFSHVIEAIDRIFKKIGIEHQELNKWKKTVGDSWQLS